MTYRECMIEAMRRCHIPPRERKRLLKHMDKTEPVGAHQANKQQSVASDEEMIQMTMRLFQDPQAFKQLRIIMQNQNRKN